MSVEIEALIAAEEWGAARALIRAKLAAEPESHWLLTRLGLTYYEQRRYREALRHEERALRLAPRCPLVLWDYAGTLDMLGRTSEALRVYRRLIRRGVEALVFGACGEGRAWARGLVADCWYRVALCQQAQGRRRLAVRALEAHLALRGPGCRSIYEIGAVRRRLAALREGIA